LLAKTVNDNAKNQTSRSAPGFFASKLAPTKVTDQCPCLAGHLDPIVGASLLAKTVNDNAKNQPPAALPGFSRASSLLQELPISAHA